MGLLDTQQSNGLMDFGMGLLSAGGPSRMPVGFGQAMGQGMNQMQAGNQQRQATQMQDMQMQNQGMQLQQHQMQMEQAKKAIADNEMAKAKLGQYVQSLPDTDPNKAQIVQAVQMGVPMHEVWKKINPEAKYETIFNKDGTEGRAFVAPGQAPQIVGGSKALPLHFQDTGGGISGVNPLTGQPVVTYGKSMTLAENTNAALAREKFGFEKNQAGKPQFKDGYWVTPPNAGNANGTITATPFAVPPKGSPAALEKSSTNAIQLIDQADKLLNDSTSSYIGTGADMAAQAFGFGTKGANASAKLKAMEGALMMAQPRMEGPQSDKDVALYRQMAGQIGDSTIPVSTRRAALESIREMHQKYAPEAGVKSSISGGGWSATVIK